MKFKSKVGLWVYLTAILLAAIACFFVTFFFITLKPAYVVGIAFTFAVSIFYVPVIVDTNYTFLENEIKIKSGLTVNESIKYSDILSFHTTRVAYASAGLSTDRIEIRYMRGDVCEDIYISPENTEIFLYILTERVNKVRNLKINEQ